MNVILGRTEQIKKSAGTYDSIFLAAHIFATATNTALVVDAFNPAYVKVKVFLQQKDGAIIGQPLLNDSLLLLGTDASLMDFYRQFRLGVDKTLPAVGVKAIKMRYVEIPFSHTRVAAGQELVFEVTVGSDSVYSAAVDTALSCIQFEANPSMGYDTGDYTTEFIPIAAQQPSAALSIGDNVVKIKILNFDKTDYSSPVISGLALGSDRIQETLDFNKLLARTIRLCGKTTPQMVGSAFPIAEGGTASVFGMNYLPQTHVLFDGTISGQKMDKVHLDITFNSANVSASQNYIAVTRYKTTLKRLVEAQDRQKKHRAEEINKLGK